MDRGDDEVERGERRCLEIESAVGEDVDLDPGQDRDSSTRAFTSRMRAAWANARASSRPLAIARDCEWSVMQMYQRSASRAAIAIVSISWRPSDAVVCMWTSPLQILERDQARQGARIGGVDSPRDSRSVGSIHGKPRAA